MPTVNNEFSFLKMSSNYILSAILYTSYNSIILIPMLFSIKNIVGKKMMIILGLSTSVLLGILMYGIYRINSGFYPQIVAFELPNMLLSSLISPKISFLYAIVILCAIFTTAFSCGFSFLNMRKGKNYNRNALIICILAVLLSKIGFSNFIDYCFPIFGFVGLFQIALIFINILFTKRRKNG